MDKIGEVCLHLVLSHWGLAFVLMLGHSFLNLSCLRNFWVSNNPRYFYIASFYPKLLYTSSMEPSINRTTVFKLIVLGIELHTAFEERENKKKRMLNFNSKIKSFLSFPTKLHYECIFVREKNNSKLRNVYKHSWLMTTFTNKECYERF